MSQQRIGGDVLTLDIESIQQRTGHRDLVGARACIIAVYRQGPDFFGVYQVLVRWPTALMMEL